mmetsp:Transcript_34977/g.82937  ORF Transcript_34977/g.82937 Transcript_34977/m.82937 type:complete len:811 (+) Transcript_34977:165-2597(+)
MSSWLQNQLRAAEGLFEAVDRTAKVTRESHAHVGIPLNYDFTPGKSASGSSTRVLSETMPTKGPPKSQGSSAVPSKKAKSSSRKGASISRSSSHPVSSQVSPASAPDRQGSSSEAAVPTAEPDLSTGESEQQQQQQESAAGQGAGGGDGAMAEAAAGSGSARKPAAPGPAAERPVDLGAAWPPEHSEQAEDGRRPADAQGLMPGEGWESFKSIASPDAPPLAARPDGSAATEVPQEARSEGNRPPDPSADSGWEYPADPEEEDQSPGEGPEGRSPSGAGSDVGTAEPLPEHTRDSGAVDSERCPEDQESAPEPDAVADEDSMAPEAKEEGLGGGRQEEPAGQAESSGREEPGLSVPAGGVSALHSDLEEARELANMSSGSGTSREARLQRVCDKLRERLEELKGENQQLEELLLQADARATGGYGEVDRLKAEMREIKSKSAKTESSLQSQIESKNAEIQQLRGQAEKFRSEVEVLEGKLSNVQNTTEELLRERQTSESRLVAALREQLAEAEQKLDDERAAHSTTRKAAASRQEQLEANLSESATELAALQRAVDERALRVSGLESHIAVLEDEQEQLSARLRRAEETAAREKARADANSDDALEAQVEAWKEEADKAHRRVIDLEEENRELCCKHERLGQQVQELQEASAAARSATDSDLSRRFKEVTELLYLKQTQLEKMAAEKAAQQLSLEREISGLREELDRSRRRGTGARDPMETYGSEMTPMDTMGAAYQRLANDERLGRAVKGFAKAVDVTAANAMRLLRQYPLARVVFFLYSIFIHLFVYVLIQRLQSRLIQIDNDAAEPS